MPSGNRTQTRSPPRMQSPTNFLNMFTRNSMLKESEYSNALNFWKTMEKKYTGDRHRHRYDKEKMFAAKAIAEQIERVERASALASPQTMDEEFVDASEDGTSVTNNDLTDEFSDVDQECFVDPGAQYYSEDSAVSDTDVSASQPANMHYMIPEDSAVSDTDVSASQPANMHYMIPSLDRDHWQKIHTELAIIHRWEACAANRAQTNFITGLVLGACLIAAVMVTAMFLMWKNIEEPEHELCRYQCGGGPSLSQELFRTLFPLANIDDEV